ncbi:MAG TPA: nucleotidyltransferase family protein [Bryobacteraceae bacterium]|nr:nucleotidyltransferase family protein [Bryobacteraceae bacterium]
MTFGAVILAAGASRRMGFPKPLLRIDGELLGDRMLRIFRQCCSHVVIVLRDESLADQLSQPAIPVVNPAPEQGQLSSLQCGLLALPPMLDGVFFTPVDYPALDPETPLLLASAFRQDDAVLAPAYDGQRGHPVLIAARVVPKLLALNEGAAARDVIRAENVRSIATSDRGILHDVDTPEDLNRVAEVSL